MTMNGRPQLVSVVVDEVAQISSVDYFQQPPELVGWSGSAAASEQGMAPMEKLYPPTLTDHWHTSWAEALDCKWLATKAGFPAADSL